MVTMNDIAARAGVAQSTVSYVLNGQHEKMGISVETCQRIHAAAADLGYRRNSLARAMVTGRNQVLAMLIAYPDYEQVGSMLQGALEAADEAGYSIKVLYCGNPETEAECIERCFELRVAGIITLHARPALLRRLYKESARHGVPVATLDSSFPQPGGIRVISDDRQGMGQAVDHLVQLGHRAIALLSVSNDGAAALREAGYQEALHRHGIEAAPSYLVHAGGYWNDAQAAAAVRQLLAAPAPPTALICVGDALAMVAMRTARRLGVSVPEQLAVVGYSDLAMAQRADPPLTTIAQPFRDMGRHVVRHTLAAIDAVPAGGRSPLVELLPTELVVRESTAAPENASNIAARKAPFRPARSPRRRKIYASN